MTEQPDRTWTDDEVQSILRRFASTRETLGAILQLVKENLESEAAFAMMHGKATVFCPTCEGDGTTGRGRCGTCKGIGRLIGEVS